MVMSTHKYGKNKNFNVYKNCTDCKMCFDTCSNVVEKNKNKTVQKMYSKNKSLELLLAEKEG